MFSGSSCLSYYLSKKVYKIRPVLKNTTETEVLQVFVQALADGVSFKV